MKNKKELALFMYKPEWWVEKLFILKGFETYYPCILKKERIKAQTLVCFFKMIFKIII